jgi:uncharacterized protein (TIGR00290 family)
LSKVFASWSGGKDCCLACYRAINQGLQVCYLANMMAEDGQRSRTHGLSAHVLQLQAQAIGIPLVQRPTTWGGFEAAFKENIRALRQEGIEGGVFGDIDLNEHREWVERVCQEAGITAHLPLWGERQEDLLRDFVNSGFEAVVVATRADLLGEEWLGRRIDQDFIEQIRAQAGMKDITPSGEAGEYHTLVIDGPLFQKRLEIRENGKTLREKHWLLKISEAQARDR